MNFLPICVKVDGLRIVMIGGGSVALQKLKALLAYASDVTVCAPRVCDEIKASAVRVLERAYSPEVLDGAGLVYACTGSRELNRRIRDDAHARGIPANVADDPKLCDFISPAIYKRGRMSVAVSSNGEDVKTSLAWRAAIRQMLDDKAGQV